MSNEIMTPKEVAAFFRKSSAWVYKHKLVLGCLDLPGRGVGFSRSRILTILESQKIEKPTLAQELPSKRAKEPLWQK